MKTIEVVITAEVAVRYECEACGAISEEVLAVPLYECPDCYTIYNRDQTERGDHRCPDCNRFGRKIADRTCAACDEGVVEEMRVAICPICDEDVELDELRDHIVSDCISGIAF